MSAGSRSETASRAQRRESVLAGALGFCAAVALVVAPETATASGYQQTAQAAYHIAISPSGVPYVVQPGQAAGGAVWPYQNQPFAPQPLPPQALAAPAPAPAPVSARPASPPPEREVAPPPAPPPTPAPQVDFSTTPSFEPAMAEQPPPPKVYEEGFYAIDEDYLLSWPENVYRFFTAPLRFDETDWYIAAGVAGVTGALFLADKVLIDFWQDDVRGDFTDDAADVFRPLGGFQNLLYGTLGAYGVAELLDSSGAIDMRREKAAALMAFESLVLTAVLTQGSKWITGRKRPADTDDKFDFNGPGDFDTNDAFWSGHSSEVFAVASVISEVYAEDQPWVPYVAYTLATGTALSRVNDERHWFSDVFVGAAAGYFIGKLVTRFNPFLEEQGVGVSPLMQEGTQGLNFTYKF